MVSILESLAEAVAGIPDGATVMIGGFGTAGQPVELIDALVRSGATGLTVVSNNAGNGDAGLAALIGAGRVRKMVCSFPRQADSWHFDKKYRDGEIELDELGNLVYRKTARNFGPIMAAAATTTVVQVQDVVPAGALDPEIIVTPCIYVDRIIRVPAPARAPEPVGAGQ